jgi:inner membrane protein involved in colicin E2 resistance
VAADSQKTKLSWQNQKLITGQDIALEFIIPGNHGETAYRLFYYSPLAMALFIMLLLVFSVAKEIKLHPMHYLFLITGFFIFYLLASYLITYVPIIPGIMISVLVSTGIMLYYVSMLKKGTVFMQAVAMGSVIFQWIFSIAFFFPAHTGFTITIASILAFIVLMKQTASVEWNSKW